MRILDTDQLPKGKSTRYRLGEYPWSIRERDIDDAIAEARVAHWCHAAQPKTAGLYLILNVVSGFIYVGRSSDVRYRMCSHFSNLKTGRHVNHLLLADYRKHGKDSFGSTIVTLTQPWWEKDAESIALFSIRNRDNYNINNMDYSRKSLFSVEHMARLIASGNHQIKDNKPSLDRYAARAMGTP